MENQAAQALIRFGLGHRAGEALAADPRAWLRAQLAAPDPAPAGPSTQDGLVLARQVMMMVQAAKRAGAEPARDDNMPVADSLRAEVHGLLANAVTTEAPFRERLVWFWLNHFTVAARDRIIGATAGAYVREAIRPHVTGKFRDMLLAVMRHPAMLVYLDQAQSAGPDSVVGQKSGRGLNENLARECLELHTVTPASGYTQADVTAFARVLTGWSIELHEPPVGFRFRDRAHEPGAKHVMGYDWEEGEAGGVALLTWLADHPATHRHLAQKLVRHFVADDPPPGAVRTIEGVLRDTGGDLGAASAALVELPAAWHPLTKLRTPQEYAVACLRATGADPSKYPNLGPVIASLGQPLFRAPFPNGWPDRAADWAGGEAMLQRVDFAYAVAGRAPDADPEQIAGASLGALLRPATLDAVRGAGSRQEALTLLFGAPEFQRR